MKKPVAYILSWTLYWLGDLISHLLNFESLFWLYPVYNRFMQWSLRVQDWAGNTTPWRKKNQ